MEINDLKKKLKVLKYPCAHIEDSDEIVVAEEITDENRLLPYYLIGEDKDGQAVHVPLIAVKCKGKKRNYFKRYPEGSKHYVKPEVRIVEKGYRELSAHAYFKYLFTSGEVTQIHVESISTIIGGLETKIKREEVIHITNGKPEVPDKLDEKLRSVVYDVLVDSRELGKVALECFITHQVDDVKKEKLYRIGINALELNLSCLKDKDGILTDEDKNNIRYMIQTMKFKWVNSTYKNEIDLYESMIQEDFEGNVLISSIKSHKPELGERFYLAKNDTKHICPTAMSGRCPVESICRNCKRLVTYNWNDNTADFLLHKDNYVICNQSKEKPITRRWLMEKIREGLDV